MSSSGPVRAGFRTLAGRARLFLARPDDWEGADSLALLSEDERGRYERFRVEGAARAFLTGRALLRCALSAYASPTPASWEIEPDEHGRPRLVGAGATHRVAFNLSHTDQLVACLLTSGPACGVDVEALDRRVDPLPIARHSFAPEEIRALEELEGEDRREHFFTLWTLKEAYLKARGRGIAMRLDSASFSRPRAERLRAVVSPPPGGGTGRWRFRLYEAAPRHRLAVALAREGATDLELEIYRALPGDLERPATDVELLATDHRSST